MNIKSNASGVSVKNVNMYNKEKEKKVKKNVEYDGQIELGGLKVKIGLKRCPGSKNLLLEKLIM